MDWYDRAELYDRAFAWDPGPERDFVLGASERWGRKDPRRILEPFCGTGRLLREMPGVAVGFDKNPHMLRVARRRVFRADAGRFAVRDDSFDLAYCLIDSFRYLLTERAARDHLRAVARALRPGGVYVLGFDVEGGASTASWDAGGVRVEVSMLGDEEARVETMRTRLFADGDEIESLAPMRTYTTRQVEDLVDGEGSFEIAAAFQRGYDLDDPVELSEVEGGLVLVLSASR